MSEYRIRVDPRNPGLYFACCGLFEVAELLEPGGAAWFEADGRDFCLRTAAPLPPDPPALEEASSEEGADSILAIEPLTLRFGARPVRLNWWLDNAEKEKSALKTWGGQQTSRSVLSGVLSLVNDVGSVPELFSASVFTTTRFGVDSRSAWEPIDLGYSPNDVARKDARTYPWVELLSVVGLQGFRPAGRRRDYRYSTWLEPLPIGPARAACAAPWHGLERNSFDFKVVGRGQGYKTFAMAKGAN